MCFLRIRRDDFFESSFEEIARKVRAASNSIYCFGPAADCASRLIQTPEELRRRLAVDFQGENGVDAGGLTR